MKISSDSGEALVKRELCCPIHSIAVDGNILWAATEEGLVQFDANTLTPNGELLYSFGDGEHLALTAGKGVAWMLTSTGEALFRVERSGDRGLEATRIALGPIIDEDWEYEQDVEVGALLQGAVIWDGNDLWIAKPHEGAVARIRPSNLSGWRSLASRTNPARVMSPVQLSIASPPAEVGVGKSVELKFTLTNFSNADHSGISVSFPALTKPGSVSSAGPYDSELARIEINPASDKFSDGIGFFDVTRCVYIRGSTECREHPYLLVEANQGPWRPGESRSFTLKITPQQPGWLEILVRGWSCRGVPDGYGECQRHPQSDNLEDQQGWPVVLVGHIKVSSTDALKYQSPKGYFVIDYHIEGESAVPTNQFDGLYDLSNAPDYVELVATELDWAAESLSNFFRDTAIQVNLQKAPRVRLTDARYFLVPGLLERPVVGGLYDFNGTLYLANRYLEAASPSSGLRHLLVHELFHWIQHANNDGGVFACAEAPVIICPSGWAYEGTARWVQHAILGELPGSVAFGSQAMPMNKTFYLKDSLLQKTAESVRGYSAWSFWHFLFTSNDYGGQDRKKMASILKDLLAVPLTATLQQLDDSLKSTFGADRDLGATYSAFVIWVASGQPLGGVTPPPLRDQAVPEGASKALSENQSLPVSFAWEFGERLEPYETGLAKLSVTPHIVGITIEARTESGGGTLLVKSLNSATELGRMSVPGSLRFNVDPSADGGHILFILMPTNGSIEKAKMTVTVSTPRFPYDTRVRIGDSNVLGVQARDIQGGIEITEVQQGAPASSGGLKVGDIIESVYFVFCSGASRDVDSCSAWEVPEPRQFLANLGYPLAEHLSRFLDSIVVEALRRQWQPGRADWVTMQVKRGSQSLVYVVTI